MNASPSSWSDQSESLGETLGNWVLQQFALPQPIQSLLGQEYLGNTVMAYGFLAAAIGVGWFAGLIASLIVGRLIRLALSRFPEALAKGMARAVSGPLHLAILCWFAVAGTAFLAQPPEPEPAAAKTAVETKAAIPPASKDGASAVLEKIPFQWKPHYTRLVLRGFFSFILVLSLCWIVARIASFLWRSYLSPWVTTSVREPERHYFPVLYRVLLSGWWLWSLLHSFAALGLNAQQTAGAFLRFSAANNTISEYLSFLGLVVLTLLLARSLFNTVIGIAARVVAKMGGDRVNLRETWFAGLEQPVVYLITLLGIRIAAQILNPASGEFLNIHGMVTTAIHLCLTFNIAWICFVLIDKFFEYILFPLAEASETIDVQLLYLGRKTAKVGVSVIGCIFMLKAFGQDPAAVLAGLGIGGLAVSFAARDAISPFISGLALYATRPFRIRDYVRVDTEGDEMVEGMVEDIGLSITQLRKRDGTLLMIPNNHLTASVVHNRTVNKRTQEEIPLNLHMETEPAKRDQAIGLFLRIATGLEGVRNAEISFTAYGNESISLVLTYWVDDARRLNEIRTRILLEIDARLREIDVHLAVPTVAHSFTGKLPEPEALAQEAVNLRGDLLGP
ncbi:MAG: mechanosensitive ion channel family protein [Verrucomicrobia bacterium]|nr:mechanosensitive ion channel family protein [Verrucomicrobiota bacterium]